MEGGEGSCSLAEAAWHTLAQAVSVGEPLEVGIVVFMAIPSQGSEGRKDLLLTHLPRLSLRGLEVAVIRIFVALGALSPHWDVGCGLLEV